MLSLAPWRLRRRVADLETQLANALAALAEARAAGDAARADAARALAEAELDPLTGLLNRRGLAAAYERIDPAGVAVLLLDLDGFKNVNDEHGHPAGDEAICVIADRLANLDAYVVARLGGDEFVIVIPKTGAYGAASRIAALVGKPIVLSDEVTVKLTASVGMVKDPTGDLSKTVQRADLAMYRAKESRAFVAVNDPRLDRPADAPGERRRHGSRALCTAGSSPTVVVAA